MFYFSFLRHVAGRAIGTLAVGALVILPAAAPSSSRRLPPGAVSAWAMPGHDPQRTAQGSGVGPRQARAPHLVLKGLYSYPPAIARDGTVFGFLTNGRGTRSVVAVSPDGHIRWTANAGLPAWWSAESPDNPALAPDGGVTFGGGACARPGFVALDRAQGMGADGCLTMVGPDGRVRWRAATRGLTKGGPSLLIRPDGTVVRATIGPSSGFVSPDDDARRSLTFFAPDGTARRLGAGCSWTNTALGNDGTLYAIASAHPGGPCPHYDNRGQDSASVVAFTSGGARAWIAPLPTGCTAGALAVGRKLIYTSALCGLVRSQQQPRVYALDAQGRVKWMVNGIGSEYPTLAVDRASGDLWIADTTGLQRVTPAGALEWQTLWGARSGIKETLVLDAQGMAYTCGSDGLLRAINSVGQVRWQYRFTVPSYGLTSPPGAAIGPDGKLYISGANQDGMVVFWP